MSMVHQVVFEMGCSWEKGVQEKERNEGRDNCLWLDD